MKILQGQLTETRYDFPETQAAKESAGAMEVTLETVYIENQVAYMSDELGVHRMWNNGTDFAVSLHLYTPPNIVRDGCYIFDGNTGKSTHIKTCDYFSVRGKLVVGVVGKSSESTE